MFSPSQKTIPHRKLATVISILLLLSIVFSIFTPFTAYAQTQICNPDDFSTCIVAAAKAIAGGPLVDLVVGAGLAGAEFVADSVFGLAFRGVTWVFKQFANWLMLAGSSLLDASINFSLESTHYRLDSVQTGWTVFRDLANMVFIFVLVYIAIATILQLSNFNTKRVLATLIIVALLLNFSFFLTGIVIDISNISSKFLYDSMTIPSPGEFKSIGGQFIEGLKLPSTEDFENVPSLDEMQKGLLNIVTAIFEFIAAFVFLSGAFLFIFRTVALMLILIAAPLAFAAAAPVNLPAHFVDRLVSPADAC